LQDFLSEENHRKYVLQSTNLELGNNDAVIIVIINPFISTSCWKLLRGIVVKSYVWLVHSQVL